MTDALSPTCGACPERAGTCFPDACKNWVARVTAEPIADPEDAPYLAMLTFRAFQHGQEVVLRYAHHNPTIRDVRRMVELMRRTADRLSEGLIVPPINEVSSP